MIKRRTLAVLFIGGITAGALSLAASASAAPLSPLDGARSAFVMLSDNVSGVSTAAVGKLPGGGLLRHGVPPAPPDGAGGAIGGKVGAVNGSTYTMDGPEGSSLTINATSSTTYVKTDGSSTDASAVKAGAFITAEGTFSNQGKTLTAQRITIGAPKEGGHFISSVRSVPGGPPLIEVGPGKGALPIPVDGATAGIGGPVASVSGSTYTIGGPEGPDGSALTINATSSTTYVKADGSSTDASAVKAGVFIEAEGTLSNEGKTLTAQRITVGAPQGGFSVGLGDGASTGPVLQTFQQ